MDQLLLPDDVSTYLAENSVRSLTTPTFIPAVIYRRGYFLPYLYFGTAALLYSLAHIFLIIFTEEERQQQPEEIEDHHENDKDLTHENALYGSIVITAVGSYFAVIALIRLLEVWIRVGLQRNLHLSKYYLGILSALLSAIPFILSLSGDIILVTESHKEEERARVVRKALILKLLGATFNVILILVYLILCSAYAISAFISNIAEESRRDSVSRDLPLDKKIYVKKTFRDTIIMLLVLGLLTMARCVYDLYAVAELIKIGPFWDVYSYLILVVIDGIAFLVMAFLLNLSRVNELVVFKHMKPGTFIKKKKNHNSLNMEEVIPLSRSPIHIEEYR
ncbi:hypothetical protein INT47_005983 [Mucor saturninus]|uniref:Uncharacterized protein n=1 Tax=Mucor saturninus TaxID=64648 RepID=A0A8H7QPW6_9FUNG|nr:hypothetical protein INT47_005983 [Mucor saturninus]